MCKGPPTPPELPAPSPASLRRRAAAMEAELALARARLEASVEALRREREKATELLRRLERSLTERERLRKMVAAMDVVRGVVVERRLGAGDSDEGASDGQPIRDE